MKRYQSGAAKRKKAKEDEDALANLPKLTSFLTRASCPAPENISSASSGFSPENTIAAEPGDSEVISNESTEIPDNEVETDNVNQLHRSYGEEIQTMSYTEQSSSHVEERASAISDGFDVGDLQEYGFIIPVNERANAVKLGPKLPTKFPNDKAGEKFPVSVLVHTKRNGERSSRDYLTWSDRLQSLFCFPCRLFGMLDNPPKSQLGCPIGWSAVSGPIWRKLYDRLVEHEGSNYHRQCYISWRQLESSLKNQNTVDVMLQNEIMSNRARWRTILKRLLHVVFFLAERGLPFRGDSLLIGHKSNGLFLGMLEVIAKYDSILNSHLEKVRQSQVDERREQVHYLSPESQNEFIQACSEKLQVKILCEISEAKYFSIMLDSKPDASHTEQTTLIIRYVGATEQSCNETIHDVQERFLTFHDFAQKKGEDIAKMALSKLAEWNIPFSDCQGQGYDNSSNMSGIHNGVQAILQRENQWALYSPCACHSLNLCGSNAAQCCPDVITYFGMVQKLFTFFSASPQRWEFLQQSLGCSLHSMSGTRWSERVDAVRPVAAHPSAIMTAVRKASELTLTPEAATCTELQALKQYFSSFLSILMSSIWIKVLFAIDERNRILQARKSTVDVEVSNLQDLITELTQLRNQWRAIWQESVLVAGGLGIEQTLPAKRKRQRKHLADETPTRDDPLPQCEGESEAETTFRINVFYALIDAVLQGLTTRFDAVRRIDKMFGFFYKYYSMPVGDLKLAATRFYSKYTHDVSEQLVEEVLLLWKVGCANFGTADQPSPLMLLNKLHESLFD